MEGRHRHRCHMEATPAGVLPPQVDTLPAPEPLQGILLIDLLGDPIALDVEIACPVSASPTDAAGAIASASTTLLASASASAGLQPTQLVAFKTPTASAVARWFYPETKRIWITRDDPSDWDWESPPFRAEAQNAFWGVHVAIGITTAEAAADLAQDQAAAAAVAAAAASKAVAAAARPRPMPKPTPTKHPPRRPRHRPLRHSVAGLLPAPRMKPKQ